MCSSVPEVSLHVRRALLSASVWVGVSVGATVQGLAAVSTGIACSFVLCS